MASEYKKFVPTTQLFVGSLVFLEKHVLRLVQKEIASCGGCSRCVTCTSIETKQHSSLLWLSPSKRNYTIDELEQLFYMSSFSLGDNQSFFFIINRADDLSAACANRLLKLLEEPPRGYFFILLAQRKDAVIETIRSRSHITIFSEADQQIEHLWHAFFTTQLQQGDPLLFLQALESAEELERVEHLDAIVNYWQQQYLHTLDEKNQLEQVRILSIIDILMNAYKRLPMPGSGKIFWKNLLLQLPRV